MKLTKEQQMEEFKKEAKEALEEEYTKQMEEFKKEMTKLLRKMTTITCGLPYKGDTCEESQKICLINAINTVRQSVNGITISDFVEGKN